MAKVQIFKMTEENSELISKFVETHKITEQGILISEGTIGFIYRDVDDWGLSKQDTLSALSGELSKAQKQFHLQEALRRGYEAMVVYYTKKKNEVQAKYDGIINSINELEEKKNKDLEGTEFEALTQKAKEIEAEYKKVPKDQKDALLEQLHATNEKIKEVEPTVNSIIEDYNNTNANLTKQLAELSGELKGLGIKVEENTEFAKGATQDRDHATEFIITTTAYIAEIEGAVTQG